MSVNRRVAFDGPHKRGHPRNDEIVAKPFVKHTRKDIKPENRMKYAEETIRNAKNILRYYEKGYPNPLNIDIKDLCPESRETWKAIFGMRGTPPENVMKHSENQRAFDSAEEVVFAFESYIFYIKEHNFVKEFTRPDGSTGVMPIVPNQTNLARWLGINTQRISSIMSSDERAMEKYRLLLADCLSEGAMSGVYQSTMTQFTLKNMCDWADKYEDRSANKKEIIEIAEAEELMKKLGYTREKATLDAPKPVLEAGDE